MTTNRDLRILLSELILKVGQVERRIMKTLQDLLDEVESEKTVVSGILTLVQGLREQLNSANLPPEAQAKVDAIFDKMEENKNALAQALVQNTPNS